MFSANAYTPCRWLHAAVCTVAVLTLAWAAVGQWIIWVPFLSDERLSLRGQLAEVCAATPALCDTRMWLATAKPS